MPVVVTCEGSNLAKFLGSHDR